jgi:hypothetical protein
MAVFSVRASPLSQRRHASLRVELEVGLRPLLAFGHVDELLLVLLATLLEHDMRGQ